jgi:arginase family enzyme
MPLRMVLEHGMVAAEDVVLWGARNLDRPEVEFIAQHGIGDDPAPVLERADAVYVAIDLDVLAPGEMAVFMPEPGGPSLGDVELFLSDVGESGKLAGAGFTGLAPDPANAEKLQKLTNALGL